MKSIFCGKETNIYSISEFGLHILTVNIYQDAFDHDKGQKSAISGRCLHFIVFEFNPVDAFLVLLLLCAV